MRVFSDGSAAIVRGALDAGCSFFAGYPITPASPILMAMMSELPKKGGVAIQAEDEIAAIGMCIGASMTGARALTATSGPGISLYSENIGLAIMGEVPLVIVDVQRLGPATGGATTVGQGDVQFVRWGTAGGFPIVALAPSSAAECYGATMRAFDLAERLRTPVFVLTDKEIDLTASTIETGRFLRFEVGARPEAGPGSAPYRFDPAENVPPMPLIGGKIPVRFTGSTHDERAFLTKDPATVARLNEHLVRKIEARASEIEWVHADEQPGAEILVVAYGVTAGAAREAVEDLRRGGTKASLLVPVSLWPIPAGALARACRGKRRIVVAELNQGLYAREIAPLAGGAEVVSCTRMDGELISPEQIERACR
ncbi:MAG: 2-oxoacid:acceptor oxidoreductase subunit alpha [Planctomycetota bacterium]